LLSSIIILSGWPRLELILHDTTRPLLHASSVRLLQNAVTIPCGLQSLSRHLSIATNVLCCSPALAPTRSLSLLSDLTFSLSRLLLSLSDLPCHAWCTAAPSSSLLPIIVFRAMTTRLPTLQFNSIHSLEILLCQCETQQDFHSLSSPCFSNDRHAVTGHPSRCDIGCDRPGWMRAVQAFEHATQLRVKP